MSAEQSQVAAWLKRLSAALSAPDEADWGELFVADCYWRDFLAFTWSIVTLEGVEAIAAMAADQLDAIGPVRIEPADPALPMSDANQGWFTLETATARGRGHVLLEDGKARVLLTAMDELIGHEEPAGKRRPAGIEHRAWKGRKFWIDEREEEARTLGHEVQPYCLIVGGGQNGLQLAARLKRLGVPTIIVDAHERPGDCWRVRYRGSD